MENDFSESGQHQHQRQPYEARTNWITIKYNKCSEIVVRPKVHPKNRFLLFCNRECVFSSLIARLHAQQPHSSQRVRIENSRHRFRHKPNEDAHQNKNNNINNNNNRKKNMPAIIWSVPKNLNSILFQFYKFYNKSSSRLFFFQYKCFFGFSCHTPFDLFQFSLWSIGMCPTTHVLKHWNLINPKQRKTRIPTWIFYPLCELKAREKEVHVGVGFWINEIQLVEPRYIA